MRLFNIFNIFIIIFLAIVALRVNGIFSFLELCLDFLIVWLTFTERYSFFYFAVLFFSFGLSMYSLSKEVSGFTSADEMKIYNKGMDRGYLFNAAECRDFKGAEFVDFVKIKNEQYENCASQTQINVINQSAGFMSAFMSGVFTEFAIVSPLFPQKKADDKCLHSINKLIQLCPDEAVFYDQKILAEMNRKDADR